MLLERAATEASKGERSQEFHGREMHCLASSLFLFLARGPHSPPPHSHPTTTNLCPVLNPGMQKSSLCQLSDSAANYRSWHAQHSALRAAELGTSPCAANPVFPFCHSQIALQEAKFFKGHVCPTTISNPGMEGTEKSLLLRSHYC